VATHRLLTDLRRFDDHAGWARQGALSCAHWLSWRCGIALARLGKSCGSPTRLPDCRSSTRRWPAARSASPKCVR
jgi:hypothetical protein